MNRINYVELQYMEPFNYRQTNDWYQELFVLDSNT